MQISHIKNFPTPRNNTRFANPLKILVETKAPLAQRIKSGAIEAGKEAGAIALGFAMLLGIAALIFPVAGPIMAVNDIEKDKITARELLSSDEFKKAATDIEKISNDPFYLKKLTAWDQLVNGLKTIKK